METGKETGEQNVGTGERNDGAWFPWGPFPNV